MTLSERLQYCKVCQNNLFDPKTGINCRLTNAKPQFEEKCEQFVINEAEAQKLLARKKHATEQQSETGFFAPEKKGMKKGVVGGVIMIVIALVWFFGGLAAGIIFYYPPILFIIGIVGVIKGLAEGNLSGERYR